MAAVYGRTLLEHVAARREEVEREPEFHPQLARGIADICHRLAALTAADGAEVAPLPPPAAELARYVAELRALLDAFAPSVQVVMTCANILFAALPLGAVPLYEQLRWLHVLAGADHLARVPSFRDAEGRINSVRGFLEGLPPAPAGYAQPEQPPSRALACALVPQWACRLSPSSRHLGAQLAIVVRNLCTVVAECALGEAGEGGEIGSAPLCALAATNAMVAIVKHWTGGLRQPATAADADADWAAATARSGWQGELLLSGAHVLLELLPPRAPARARAVGGLCHAAAVGLGLLLASSQATLHQLEAMRVARAHGGRPRDQFAPEGLEGSGAAFSQRILRAAVDCCTPVRARRRSGGRKGEAPLAEMWGDAREPIGQKPVFATHARALARSLACWADSRARAHAPCAARLRPSTRPRARRTIAGPTRLRDRRRPRSAREPRRAGRERLARAPRDRAGRRAAPGRAARDAALAHPARGGRPAWPAAARLLRLRGRAAAVLLYGARLCAAPARVHGRRRAAVAAAAAAAVDGDRADAGGLRLRRSLLRHRAQAAPRACRLNYTDVHCRCCPPSMAYVARVLEVSACSRSGTLVTTSRACSQPADNREPASCQPVDGS